MTVEDDEGVLVEVTVAVNQTGQQREGRKLSCEGTFRTRYLGVGAHGDDPLAVDEHRRIFDGRRGSPIHQEPHLNS